MEKRVLGRSKLEVTAVTMGCWQAGGAGWTGTDDDNSIAAIRAALDAGINCFDSAEAYGEGHSEEVLARALGDRRGEVLLATKVSAGNLEPAKLKAACEASLGRLQTDHIDLYQIHWPAGSWGGPMIPIADSMATLQELKAQGKIGAIGVSNFNKEQIAEALQYGHIDSLQPPYSLFWRDLEDNGTTTFCAANDVGVIPYSPLAQGLLTGKFNEGNRPTDDNRAGNMLFKDPHYGDALAAVEQLKPIAERYGVSTGQLALQWLLGQPGVTSVIVGARNAGQVLHNVGAAGFSIEAADRAVIDRIGRTVTATLPASSPMWA